MCSGLLGHLLYKALFFLFPQKGPFSTPSAQEINGPKGLEAEKNTRYTFRWSEGRGSLKRANDWRRLRLPSVPPRPSPTRTEPTVSARPPTSGSSRRWFLALPRVWSVSVCVFFFLAGVWLGRLACWVVFFVSWIDCLFDGLFEGKPRGNQADHFARRLDLRASCMLLHLAHSCKQRAHHTASDNVIAAMPGSSHLLRGGQEETTQSSHIKSGWGPIFWTCRIWFLARRYI